MSTPTTIPFITYDDATDKNLSHEQLTQALFRGDIFIIRNLSPVADLVAIARAIIADVFETPVDTVPDCDRPAAEIKALNFELRRRFDASKPARDAFTAALGQTGLDLTTAYRDRLILRVSAPIDDLRRDTSVTLPTHRDTWGSGFLDQINWWLPIYPLLPGNTALLYPRYWATPVANDAEGWDWRQMKHDPNYPPLPTACEPLNASDAVPLLLEPGELAIFAGAHLHATSPNHTGMPRFSADTRTVDPRHAANGIGAPDHDHANNPPATAWFRHITTDARLVLDHA